MRGMAIGGLFFLVAFVSACAAVGPAMLAAGALGQDSIEQRQREMIAQNQREMAAQRRQQKARAERAERETVERREEAEAERQRNAEEVAAKEAEAKRQANEYQEALAQLNGEPLAGSARLSIAVCEHKREEQKALDGIAEERSNAKIAGVVDMRTLYDLQSTVADERKQIKELLQSMKAMDLRFLGCEAPWRVLVDACHKRVARRELCPRLTGVAEDQ